MRLKISFYFCLVGLFLFSATKTHFAFAYDVKEAVTPESFKVLYIEDNYLPIVTIQITIRQAGYAYDPEGKEGLSYMVGSLLDEGAGIYSSLAFSKALESLASSISFSQGKDHFYISVTSLAENIEPTLALLKLALLEPRFDEDAIDRIREQIITIIQQRSERPGYKASVALKNYLYDDHPYSNSRFGNINSIKNITLFDLRAFMEGHFAKDVMDIAIAGDVDEQFVHEKIDYYLSAIPDKLPAPLVLPSLGAPKKSTTLFIEHDVPQSVVLFSMPGVLRSDERFYSAYLLNYILGGGGFESRLFKTIREENGLVYSVYSSLENSMQDGYIAGSFSTEPQNVSKAIELVKKEILDLKEHGIRSAEIEQGLDYLIYSFPLSLTKNSRLSSFLSNIQLHSLGADYLNKRTDILRDISIDEVDRSAYELLDLDHLVFVVVGQKT